MTGGKTTLETPWSPAQDFPAAEDAIRGWEEQIRLGSKPSRNRLLQSVLAATAETSQRSGTALPGFIPRGVSPQVALQIATRIDPFDRVLNTEVPLRSRGMIRRTIRNKCTAKRRNTHSYSTPKEGVPHTSTTTGKAIREPPGTRTGAQT